MKRAKKRLNYFKKNKLYLDSVYGRMSKLQQETNDWITNAFMQYYFDYKEKRDAESSKP